MPAHQQYLHFNDLQLQLALLLRGHHLAAKFLNVIVQGGVFNTTRRHLRLLRSRQEVATATAAAWASSGSTELLHGLHAAEMPGVPRMQTSLYMARGGQVRLPAGWATPAVGAQRQVLGSKGCGAGHRGHSSFRECGGQERAAVPAP
eukprot:764995-Pelagomonas_calceolata.AAC.5